VPLNAAPLAAFTYRDPTPIEFGRERCYTVRAVRGTPPNVALSARPSVPAAHLRPLCAGRADRAQLDPGGWCDQLQWEPNGEADLDGYLILRGRPGDATLQPLSRTPVKDVRYEDR
jgi:hypothetical protein